MWSWDCSANTAIAARGEAEPGRGRISKAWSTFLELFRAPLLLIPPKWVCAHPLRRNE